MNVFKLLKSVVSAVNPLAGVAIQVVETVVSKQHPMGVKAAAMVPIKPAYKSKINWLALLAIAYAAFDFFGHPVPADMQSAVTPAVNAIVPVVVIILRTWFTKTLVR